MTPSCRRDDRSAAASTPARHPNPAAKAGSFGDAGTAGKCNPSVPVCDVRLNRATYLGGDAVVAQVARLANPTAVALPVEVKLWFERPDGLASPYLSVGGDGSFVLPPGSDTDYGPLSLTLVSGTTPRGTHRFNCRVLHAVTGELLAEDINPYDVP